LFPEIKNIPLQKISNELLDFHQLNLFILRLDLVHPFICGNKWYKLKYNLEEAKRQGKNTLVTFGGAYSNHIVATAAAGEEFGFKTIGIIRGEELNEDDNSVLHFAKECGMQLRFVSREEYRMKDPSTALWVTGDYYVLPEGGTNEFAVKGCSEILPLIDIPFDYICCAVGTGGTIAGIISSLKENQKAIGFSVLKEGEFLKDDIAKLLNCQIVEQNWTLETDHHFGGYAKKNEGLLNFISDFKSNHNIPLDFVYTGKMMFGIFDLVKENYFQKGATVIAVHTGGLFQFTDRQPGH
jgi:1-aminocyclopropane-1-carboxylate deaminase